MSTAASLMRSRSLGLAQAGFGFDSHLFADRGTLVLGGQRFAGTPRLQGHSDGDALLHAVIDALLGAGALGDIGDLFPDTARRFKGIASSQLLRSTLRRLRIAGFAPTHVDVTVLADRPKLGPSKRLIQHKLARLLRLIPAQVNIKAKTQEGLCWFQPPGGIAVWAVATVVPV